MKCSSLKKALEAAIEQFGDVEIKLEWVSGEWEDAHLIFHQSDTINNCLVVSAIEMETKKEMEEVARKALSDKKLERMLTKPQRVALARKRAIAKAKPKPRVITKAEAAAIRRKTAAALKAKGITMTRTRTRK